MLNVECEKDIYNLLDRIDIEKGKNYYKNYIEYIDCDEKNDITTHSFLVESERTYDYYNVEVIVKIIISLIKAVTVLSIIFMAVVNMLPLAY